MKRIINRILQWVGYHFVGYKVDIKNLEIQVGKLTSELKDLSIRDNFEDLEYKIDNLEKKVDDDISASNKAFDDVANDIVKVEKRIKELEPSELHELSEGNCSSWLSDDTKRNIKLNINSNNDCGVCDEFILKCAELQTEIDKLKEDNKQLNKALDEERSKEAYINTELKKENKRLNLALDRFEELLMKHINLTNEME